MIAVFFSAVITPEIAQAEEPKITADAAVLIDAETGQVMYAKKADKRRSPASLTKIMTVILALEMGDLNDVVTVSKKAQNVYIGSQIYLKAGEEIKLGELVKAALMFSANDSTVAIAEHVGLSHDNFVRLMNQKALALGLVETNFVNTNGYSVPNHHSTAYELAVLTRYALQNPTFAKWVGTKEATVHWEGDRTKDIRTTNRLLRNDYPGVNGVKTGTTARAGNCLIASATRSGQQLIAVVLHSRNRYKDASKMLEYGFKEFQEQKVIEKGQVLGEVNVLEGVSQHVRLLAADDIVLKLPEDCDKVQLKKHIPGDLTAPVKKAQKAGYVSVMFNDRELKTVPLITEEKVKEQGKLQKIWQDLTKS
ncbi:MAG: D-alanyl-D-alanine carboxypeptidase [Firmicutes bacterium]|nr:D-alanyl-D-alanine carboxypeptidase [Bacillota bacterium]